MVDVNNPFDLKDLFVNEFVGDLGLFIFLSMAVIAFVSARFNVPFQGMLLLEGLFVSVVFTVASGFKIGWIIVVLVTGVLFYLAIARTFRRG